MGRKTSKMRMDLIEDPLGSAGSVSLEVMGIVEKENALAVLLPHNDFVEC